MSSKCSNFDNVLKRQTLVLKGLVVLTPHLIVDASPNYVRFELPSGESTLSLHLVNELPDESNIVVYFENENLDEEVKNLQDKGIEFTLLPTDQPWLWREARLNDPDGNRLILFKAGENRKNPPWRVQ
ncbi:Glyoxalase-like domain-containing protein [Tenacibaculum sp. MAR_2009_124]|uniref:VOC family protein n=1 Tax=Tenacibaculum sp. MAR_2009_124 TaxID=1250059 RepID=UPI000896D11E|nr:VOC family protein [Tenacibaculum sp. MAR_2009_124]SED12162.1 Glyoxalase-like domain-containing protein [Tenacibaculum sp. MAR_2009_124]